MRTKNITYAAIIAAIYALLTMFVAPAFSYGVLQVRIAEALTILPMFTKAALPGLFLGCFVANLLSPAGIVDAVFGSLATLAAAFLSHKLKNNKWLVPLPPVIVNAVVVGALLFYYYGVEYSLLLCMAWVGLGQLIACYGLGMPLIKLIEHNIKSGRIKSDMLK